MDRYEEPSALYESLLIVHLVFTKCAENLENGRRLENFSWRLWYREAHFFEEPSLPPSKPIPFDRKSGLQPIPSPAEVLSDLSESVNSASDPEETRPVVEQTQTSSESHATSRPGLARQESSSRRQNLKHLSPDSFKCLIENLEPPTAEAEKWKALKAKKEQEENIAAEVLATAATSEPRVLDPPAPAVPTDIPARARTMSDTQGSPSAMSGRSLQRVSSSIVRGFTPENPSISRRLTPIEPPAPVAQNVAEVRRKPKFFIASSLSDSDDEYTTLSLKSSIKPASKSTISPPGMKRASSNGSTKKTHFHEIVDTKILPAPPTEDESDGDEDSAVMSDDEDDEWEDSQSESGDVQDEHLFDKREDTHVTSRPSMLSTLFKSKSDYNLPSQAFRASNTFVRSRTSPSHTPRPQPFSPPTDGLALRMPAESGLFGADQFIQPIPASPRTTRRKMLASELSESLRRNLLWERQHRTMTNTAAAALKRRHTSNDLARLKEYPEGLSGKDTTPAESGNDVFDSGDAVW